VQTERFLFNLNNNSDGVTDIFVKIFQSSIHLLQWKSFRDGVREIQFPAGNKVNDVLDL